LGARVRLVLVVESNAIETRLRKHLLFYKINKELPKDIVII
jgi:hypothetical protein